MEKIRKILLFVLVCILIGENIVVQANNTAKKVEKAATIFFLRNVHNSQSVSVSMHRIKSYVFNVSGNIVSQNEINKDVSRYLYQGQESENNLNLYLFPSRVYSPNQKRFFQPDPKSQYASPYLYVGSDPVNYIDYNGKEGKRLFLYGENFVGDKNVLYSGMHDQMNLFQRDVYYVPLTDFLNEKPLCIPDWNGEVHIDAHMFAYDEKQIELVRSDTKTPFEDKYTLGGKANMKYLEGKSGRVFQSASVDGRMVGHRLRELSIAKRVKVSNVFAAGCEGGEAAKRIAQGYVAGFENREGRNVLQAFGLKKDYYAFPTGYQSSTTFSAEGSKEFRLYMLRKDQSDDKYLNYTRNKKTGAVRFKSYQVRGAEGGREEAAFVDEEGIESLAKGEITREAEPFLDVYKVAY